jgi:hypothetical protein
LWLKDSCAPGLAGGVNAGHENHDIVEFLRQFPLALPIRSRNSYLLMARPRTNSTTQARSSSLQSDGDFACFAFDSFGKPAKAATAGRS